MKKQRITAWYGLVLVLIAFSALFGCRGGGDDPAAAKAGSIKLPQTGQTTCYDVDGYVITCTDTGQDGALQKGVAWPGPRFTNADNSTPISGDVVVDQLTGLIWTTDGNAPGPAACNPGVTKTWQGALDYVACLNTNSYLGHGDWRLPNRKELKSLVNFSQINNAAWLNSQGFTNVLAGNYWSSTSSALEPGSAWYVAHDGYVSYISTGSSYHARPVRGGQ